METIHQGWRTALVAFAITFLVACKQDVLPPEQAIAPFPMPDFSLPDLQGNIHRIADYRGSIVLVNFFTTWSPQSSREVDSFMMIQKKYADKGVKIISISLDEKGESFVRPYVERLSITYPVLLAGPQFTETFDRIDSIPTTFVLDRNGTVINRYTRAITESLVIQEIEYMLQEEEKARQAANQ